MSTRTVMLAGAAALLALAPESAFAWTDADQDGIDDAIQAVHAQGLAAAFENGDTGARALIAVFDGVPLGYGIYVGYDHHPTALDAEALAAATLNPVKPYRYIDYIRAQATYAQIEAVRQLPGVTRVEAIPMMYAANHWGARVVRSRDSRGLKATENYALFPSVQENLGLDGTGIVIGVLDTGVNDDLDSINPFYPGHEALNGKFLGGGEFFFGQPLLNTGLDESMNPVDHGAEVSSYHATHVAGTAMGTGGPEGFFQGVAPAARLVDCKVLSDAGAGFGSADGVEWCIYNKDNDWGLTGADTIYAGIDVLNLSLGGLTESDGTDASSQMINAAVAAGLVVCIATGNDDAIDYIPSPAAADDCIAVGATAHQGSLVHDDDLITTFSNEGPRDSDGDGDAFDEMKPSVSAPGSGTISADGDFTSDGAGYKGLSGTSMATPHVAGVAALVRQANPALPASAVKRIFENTATHGLGTAKAARPDDPFGVDPNYNPAGGWGTVDAYAACLEAMNSTSGVQVVRERAVARPGDLEIDFHWWTQREYAFQGFNVHRAEDAGGAPGPFLQINTVLVVPAGDPVIDADDNRTLYTYVDDDPALALGTKYWYRVEWVETGGAQHQEPPVPVVFGELPRVATVFYSITHNAADNDLYVRVGTSAAYDPDVNEFFVVGESEAEADSFYQAEPTNTVTATVGDRRLWWSIPLTADDGVSAPLLPPTGGHPWFLNVAEGGYINRRGQLESFSMFVNDTPGSAGGTLYVSDTGAPVPTLEGLDFTMWIPEPGTTGLELASIAATSAEDGIRVRVTLADGGSMASVTLLRAETDRFEDRVALDIEPETRGLSLDFVDDGAVAGVDYWYWVELRDWDGGIVYGGPVSARSSAFDAGATTILPAAPNPARNHTEFRYRIGASPEAGSVPVALTVHDLRGRLVRTLVSGPADPGEHRTVWDLRDQTGRRVAHGTYYYRFTAGPRTRTAKVTVVN